MGFFSNNVGDGITGDISNFTQDVLGIKTASQNKAPIAQLPWTPTTTNPKGKALSTPGGSPSISKFFSPIDIQGFRWDQLYPYRLIVIDTSTQGKNGIVGGDPNHANYTLYGNGDDQIIGFAPVLNQWIFTLPITPQQLSINDSYSINTTATLRGVTEEHSGMKFKMISASGSLGVWPYRPTVTSAPTSPGLLRSLFGNTFNAIGSLVTSVTNVVNALTNGSTASKPQTVHPQDSQNGIYSTSYFAALTFEQFLEQYAEAKKDPRNAGWRLVFDIPKQNQSFVVSPIAFNWQQNANKPLEINYTLQLKAWRRIELLNKAKPATLNVTQVSPGLLQTLLNTISAARTTMAAATNLINAVQSDATAPLAVLTQTSLLLKDATGVAATAADLPTNIAHAYNPPITTYIYQNQSSILANNPSAQIKASIAAINADHNASESIGNAAVSSGQVGTAAAALQAASPTNQIFANPAANFTLLNSVPLSSLTLTTAQQNQINGLFTQVQQLTVNDLKQNRAIIATLATNISNYYGSSTALYSQIYGTATAKTGLLPLSVDQYQILNALYGVMEAYDILTATNYFNDISIQTNMQYVAGLADASGIDFTVPNSKIVVPVPFGLTIEGIAARYLNDPLLWLEIATLNNLREPYIDETGFIQNLLSNGVGRQITIADATNLYIGQTVTLLSSSALPTSRSILGIKVLSDSSILITLDGEANLNVFTTADKAYLKAYLPGTTNSQHQIYIPSSLVAQDLSNITLPQSVSGDSLVGLSNVDLLLTGDNDIALSGVGDFRLSAGITNLIQALNIKMGTIQGTILLHPEFGLGLRAGTSTADINIESIYSTISKLITNDPRFGGLESLQIKLGTASLTISMVVFLANQSGVLPLTYTLKI